MMNSGAAVADHPRMNTSSDHMEAMGAEVDVAARYIVSMLSSGKTNCQIAPRVQDELYMELVRQMSDLYSNHWHPQNPQQGSAYRSISCMGGKLDPMLHHALRVMGMRLGAEVAKALPRNFTLWVDPGVVSVRYGSDRAQVINLDLGTRDCSGGISSMSRMDSGGVAINNVAGRGGGGGDGQDFGSSGNGSVMWGDGVSWEAPSTPPGASRGDGSSHGKSPSARSSTPWRRRGGSPVRNTPEMSSHLSANVASWVPKSSLVTNPVARAVAGTRAGLDVPSPLASTPPNVTSLLNVACTIVASSALDSEGSVVLGTTTAAAAKC